MSLALSFFRKLSGTPLFRADEGVPHSPPGDRDPLDGHAPQSKDSRLRHGETFDVSKGNGVKVLADSFFFLWHHQCANTGYTPGYVHFSCRAPRKPEAPPPDLIAFLKSLAPACEALAPGWVDRVGQDWARGHREATGGIVKKEEFDVLMQAVELGVKKPKEEGGASKSPSKVNGKKVIDPGQKNTLDGFFKIGAAAKGGDEKGAVKKEGSSKVESVPARLEYSKPGEIAVE